VCAIAVIAFFFAPGFLSPPKRVRSGHISPMMMHKLAAMLMSMHVPRTTINQMGLLMSGHASNSTTASLTSTMSPWARGRW
jgi:hypothetical protein